MTTQTIKERIQDELEKRKMANSSYSLRALARDLNINHSLLSRIIASKIQMTPKIFDRIAGPLKLTDDETILFKQEINQRKKTQSKERIIASNFRQLKLEEFKIIQDWYNFAILELVNLESFEPSGDWIAKKLNITREEAQMALDRLITLKLIEKNSKGRFIKVTSHISVMTPEFTTIAMKGRQKAVLSKAMVALENLPIEIRDHSSITLSLDSDLLPEIKEKIKKMRRSLANYITQKSKKRDHVYELSVSFFPWTSHEGEINE